MTLQSSGAISANDINIELGRAGTATFSMNGAEERGLAGVPTGVISMSDFYGKSNATIHFQNTYASADAINQSTVAGIQIRPDGYVWVAAGADSNPYVSSYQWLLSGAASDYEAYYTRTTGISGGITENTWLNLGTLRQKQATAIPSSGTIFSNHDVQIRPVGGSVLFTVVFNCDASGLL